MMDLINFRDEIDVAARAGGDVGETVAQTGVVTYAGQEQGGSSMGNGIYRYEQSHKNPLL